MEISSGSPSRVSCLEDEILDPRVQIELENLNAATDEINRLEAGLEEANNAFRASLNETSVQLQVLSKKLGSCVEKARPYYEAKEKAKNLQLDCQRAAVQYQRANAVHQAARETISLAEERFAALREKEGSIQRKFNSAWQEMLNHATMKIVEAEAQKSASEREHQKRAGAYTTAEREVQELERKLRSAINKSRPYFNHRTATQIKLEAQKDKIYKLQKEVTLAKNNYSLTLRNLEHISEEIHELRRTGKREPGVGAEVDQCKAFVERAPSRESLFIDSKCDKEHEYWSNLKDKLDELSPNEMECFAPKPEMMELSSSVNKDITLISSENLDHNTSSERLRDIPFGRESSKYEGKDTDCQDVAQSTKQEVTDVRNMQQDVGQVVNQESAQIRSQYATDTHNRNQEFMVSEKMIQHVTTTQNENQETTSTQNGNLEVTATQNKNEEVNATQNINTEATATQNRNQEATTATHNENLVATATLTRNQEVTTTQNWNQNITATQNISQEITATQNVDLETQNIKEINTALNGDQEPTQFILQLDDQIEVNEPETGVKGQPKDNTERDFSLADPGSQRNEATFDRAYKSLPNMIIIERKGENTEVLSDEHPCDTRLGS